MSTTPGENSERTDGPSNVLLLASSMDAQEDDVCGELLHGPAPKRDHALLITCLQSPEERLAAWTDGHAGHASDATVVDVETSARSTAAAAGGDVPTDAVVEYVPAQADLVELGDVVERHLDRLASDGETGVCVHSVSDLLQSAEEKAVFKFFEVLTSSVDQADAVGHYHMNPDVHDQDTVQTFEVLFDSVIDLRAVQVSEE